MSHRPVRSRPPRRWRFVCLWLCRYSALRIEGWADISESYVKPTFIMLPFNIISELSRTLGPGRPSVRQYDERDDDSSPCLLTITPFIFPIAMTALGLLTGMVQAYIFSILATVYIAAATRARKPEPELEPED